MDEAQELRRYLYDLQGYLVVENVLSEEQVAELNAILDGELPEFPDDWRERAKNAPQGLYNFYRFGAAGGSHGTHPGFLQFGKPFCDLMDHPLTMEMMRFQLGDCFRLDRIFGMRMREGMPSGRLHSDYGPSHPFTGATPGHIYPQPGHQARHGFAVAAFNLTDSGPGDWRPVLHPRQPQHPYPPAPDHPRRQIRRRGARAQSPRRQRDLLHRSHHPRHPSLDRQPRTPLPALQILRLATRVVPRPRNPTGRHRPDFAAGAAFGGTGRRALVLQVAV